MRSLRLLIAFLVVLACAAPAAWAITYDDVFELTAREVAEETIVRLIVDDGRAFELDADQLADLRAAGVSTTVIDAMLDPEAGRAWLEGDDFGGAAPEADHGYSTALDRAYDGSNGAGPGSTALVYSFGYYYGPLSRYYHDDPYYYPFWFAGYPCAYWPSYYAYGWRPEDDAYYAYPYVWYDASSYYCDAYYDPGYWTDLGYTVLPGSGRTVRDNGPRYRRGGITPPKGGRTETVPAIREVMAGRTTSDQVAREAPGWREAASAARASRLERVQAQTREDWMRRLSAENDARARELNERSTREWQERLNDEARQAANEAERRRETPPPPAERPQPRPEPRPEQPRQERVPPPPPAPPPAPAPPAPAPPAPAPAEKPEKGGSGDREDAGASRGGTGRGGR